MDQHGRRSRSGYVRSGIGLSLLALAIAAPLALNTGLFRGSTFIEIDRGSNIVWRLDTAGLSAALYQSRLANLEAADAWRTFLGSGSPAYCTIDSTTSGRYVITISPGRTFLASTDPDVTIDSTTPGLYVLSVSGSGGITSTALRDSLNALMTGGPRKLLVSLLAPGAANDMVLVTAGGTAAWTATPNLPRDYSHVFWLGSSVNPQSTADTSGNKHLLYATVLHREYPVAHGTTYSALRVNIHVRGGDAINGYVYNTYSTTLTSTGSGAGAIVAGDKLACRFFPKTGTSVDKPFRLYRVPDGEHVIGAGANLVYGEEIAYINIPAAEFPSTGTVSMEVTLSYAVK